MKNINEQLLRCEIDMQNLTTFIGQSFEKLKCRICEYRHLQRQLYIKDGLEKAEIYANFEG